MLELLLEDELLDGLDAITAAPELSPFEIGQLRFPHATEPIVADFIVTFVESSTHFTGRKKTITPSYKRPVNYWAQSFGVTI
jgi:hypothetical protein